MAKKERRRRWKALTRRRTRPGSAPGLLTADPDAHPTAIRVMAYGPDRVVERDRVSPAELGKFLEQWPVVWVDVVGLGSVEVIRALGERFGLHRLSLEDVLSAGQRAKLEPHPEHLFLVARMAAVNERVETEQLTAFLGHTWLLTFQERPGDNFEPVRERVRQGKGRIRTAGPDYLAYALLDAVVDGYFPVLERLGEMLDSLEEEAVFDPNETTVLRIHRVKNDLVALRRAIWPHRDMINALVRDDSPLVNPETRVYLRDCYDHAVQIIDLVEAYRDVGSGMMDTYLSTVSNRMNEVMKVLTVIATIFIPLSFVAGLYGMNFSTQASPWNMPELDWYWGYPACLGLMAAVAGGLLLYFRKRGWLG